MRRESWLIGICIALGAIIGHYFDLEIDPHSEHGWGFVLIGALVGGISAWVMYDFPQFCRSVAQASRRATAAFVADMKCVSSWKPEWLYWKAMLLVFPATLSVTLTVFVGLFGLHLLRGTVQGMSEYDVVFLAVFCFVYALVSLAFMNADPSKPAAPDEGALEKRQKYLKNVIKTQIKITLFLNPLGLIFLLVCGMKIVCRFCFQKRREIFEGGCAVAQLLGRICWFTFVYASSRERMVCLVFAALGAILCHLFGHAFIGAGAGCLIGVVYYELVSIRWLKLVPAR